MSYRLTRLEQMRVVRADGRELGRLMDLRTRAKHGPIERAESAAIDALLIGVTGWLERMGLTRKGSRQVQSKAVIAVEDDRIVVRASGTGGGKKTQHEGRTGR
jgi:sporulation protein YlmC with PRC-barrel domain